jgi:glycosyltransferase involved in cell wall biosynthesis
VQPERSLAPAFLSPSWPVDTAANGIVTYVALITEALRKLGHRPCVLANVSQDSPPQSDVFRVDGGNRTLSARLIDPLAFRICPFAALRKRVTSNISRAAHRAISEYGAELVEMEETSGLAHHLMRTLPIPVVVRLHGPFFANAVEARLLEAPGSRQRLKHEGASILEADGVTAPSREILDRTQAYYRLPPTTGIVIPYPAPCVPSGRRWRLGECDRDAIVFVGRFDRHKGGDIVVDCFRALAQRFPRIRLWFAGPDRGIVDDGGSHWTLSEYIGERAPELLGRIDILGQTRRSDLEALRRRAFAVLVASRYELLGMVVLEAMADGCPLVATRTGGIPEIVEHGRNGLLCRPNDPLDLAANLSRLLEDHEFAARLGAQAGADAAQRYDPATVARLTAEFHRDVIERHSAKRRKVRTL